MSHRPAIRQFIGHFRSKEVEFASVFLMDFRKILGVAALDALGRTVFGSACGKNHEPNYVFKPTAEQALRSNQSAARRRLNTALDL